MWRLPRGFLVEIWKDSLGGRESMKKTDARSSLTKNARNWDQCADNGDGNHDDHGQPKGRSS